MEPTTWERVLQFIKYCFHEKFVVVFKAGTIGLLGSLALFWHGPLVWPFLTYVAKFFGTILLTGGTTFTSCFISYKFDRLKNKNNGEPKGPQKNKKDKAA